MMWGISQHGNAISCHNRSNLLDQETQMTIRFQETEDVEKGYPKPKIKY